MVKHQWNLEAIKFYDYISDVKRKKELFKKLRESDVTIAVVDDGIQYPDKDNSNPTVIDDFNSFKKDLSKGTDKVGLNDIWWPNSEDSHGTNCASVMISSGNKLYGTAPGLSFCSYRTTFEEASLSLLLKNNINMIDIFNCSYGLDEGVVQTNFKQNESIIKGVTDGRNGKGCIYVFCSGNESSMRDHAHFDPILNLPETLVVGATNMSNKRSNYSDTGSLLLCVAPSGDLDNDDMGLLVFDSNYTLDDVEGTSFSAPQVSGMVGVMLTLRPDLMWHDVKDIISRSCMKNDLNAGKGGNIDDTPWFTNMDKRHFNLQYGFGLIDYGKIIENTMKHKLLPERSSFYINLPFTEAINNAVLGEQENISFKINPNKIMKILNKPIVKNLENFIIQEISLIFALPENTNSAKVHELDIKISVNNRYENDYNKQDVIIGRGVDFEVYNDDIFLPITIEFMKGEKLMIDGKFSEWTVHIKDINPETPQIGSLIGVEFHGYEIPAVIPVVKDINMREDISAITSYDGSIVKVKSENNNFSFMINKKNKKDEFVVLNKIKKPMYNLLKDKYKN